VGVSGSAVDDFASAIFDLKGNSLSPKLHHERSGSSAQDSGGLALQRPARRIPQ
jgi:hypothetical protein